MTHFCNGGKKIYAEYKHRTDFLQRTAYLLHTLRRRQILFRHLRRLLINGNMQIPERIYDSGFANTAVTIK